MLVAYPALKNHDHAFLRQKLHELADFLQVGVVPLTEQCVTFQVKVFQLCCGWARSHSRTEETSA
jgi:hypothetical protein